MRHLTLLLALSLLACNPAAAQPSEADEAKAAAAATPPRSYNVQLTEYRLSSPLEDDLSASEIVERLRQLKSDGKVDRIETVLLAALEGQAGFVEFGKTTAVVTGASHGGPGREPIQHFESRQVSTQMELLAKQEGDKTRIQVVYSVSRFEDDATEVSPPSIANFRIESTLLLKPGTPVLLGSSRGPGATYITLAIEP